MKLVDKQSYNREFNIIKLLISPITRPQIPYSINYYYVILKPIRINYQITMELGYFAHDYFSQL